MPATAVTLQDVPALALGCGVLGSGGGGATDGPALILAHQLSGGRTVLVVDDCDPDAFVACVGAYGSGTLLVETLPGPAAFHAALRGLAERRHTVDALLPLEVGGANGVLAAVVAAATGLPLIDADPMGRAFSRLSDTVLAARVPLTEIFFASATGPSAHLRADDGPQLERVLQSVLPAAGGWGAVAAFPGRSRDILPYAVRGATRLALAVGRALLRAASGDPDALRDVPQVRVVLDGWVTDVRRTPGVEVRGVASLSTRNRQPARLDFANEYLALFTAGELTASAPDVLCIVDAGWSPVAVDEIRAGQQVRVVAVDAVPDLRAAHENSGEFGLVSRGYVGVDG